MCHEYLYTSFTPGCNKRMHCFLTMSSVNVFILLHGEFVFTVSQSTAIFCLLEVWQKLEVSLWYFWFFVLACFTVCVWGPDCLLIFKTPPQMRFQWFPPSLFHSLSLPLCLASLYISQFTLDQNTGPVGADGINQDANLWSPPPPHPPLHQNCPA